MAGQQFEYAHDDIGNRTSTGAGGDENGANVRQANYQVNLLNQYESRDVPGAVDVMGVALATATMTVNSGSPYRKGEYFRKELTVDNDGNPVWQSVSVAASGESTVTGHTFVRETPEAFDHDDDGNLTQDGRWDYTWDAENRLVKMESRGGAPTGSKRRLEFAHDWRDRRIWKKVTDLDSTTVIAEFRFIYDGWNLIYRVGGNAERFVWGEDLSGSEQGAGGVGGLLWMRTGPVGHFAAYDGNGNVVGLVSGYDGGVSASYEYGPFGELIRATGEKAEQNPFRFSTKYQDDETDLLYYGYRYLKDGRWPNRDPIGERGGLNLYGFVANEPTDAFDLYGLDLSAPYRQMRACKDLVDASDTSANDQVKDALAEYVKGGAKKISYGPDDPWTQALQKHSHLDGVRARIREQYKQRCEGSYGKTSDQDDFNLNALSATQNAQTLLRDLAAPFYGINMANTTGSIRFRWQQKGANNCCCRQVLISFMASDTLRLGSNTRIPMTTIEIVSDNAFGSNGPLHNVDLEWTWTEIISY